MNALKRAAEILREDAESIRQSHTLGGDWQSEDKAKADHDEMLAVAEQLDALQQMAPAVPEGWKLVPVKPTSHMQETGAKVIRFNTTAINKLWTGNQVYSAMLAAAPQPDHSPDAGKVVPVGYLTNQAVARLQSDKRLNGEHLYAFKPDDMSKFQAVYLGPAVKDSLTVAHPAQPRNEVQAEALEEYAKALDQVFASAQEANANNCPAWHAGQFAKDARKFAARLRSNGGDA